MPHGLTTKGIIAQGRKFVNTLSEIFTEIYGMRAFAGRRSDGVNERRRLLRKRKRRRERYEVRDDVVRIVITTNSETRIKSTFFTAAANAFTL